MNRHLLRLIWNRKRHNLLLSVEIFFAFVVVLAVTAAGVNLAANWFQPLGYGIDAVWRITVSAPIERQRSLDTAAANSAVAETVRQIVATLRALPGIESVAGVGVAPYDSGDWSRTHSEAGLRMGANAATDDLAGLLGLDVVAGRWFNRDDDALPESVVPIVVNERFARQMFPEGEAVGRLLPLERRPDPAGQTPPAERIVGVIGEFRKGGELSTPQNYLFSRIRLDRVGQPGALFPSNVMVKVRPGTTAAFEETILKALQPVAREWVFSVRALDEDRKESFRGYSLLYSIIGLLAGFLILMVALGLTGVVWQMVTERTREFGLRRAKGATAVNIQRQVRAELLLIASLAVVPGALLAAQIPTLPRPSDWVIPDGVFLASVAIAVAVIYLVVLACAWYPSRMATRIHPAEALHYE